MVSEISMAELEGPYQDFGHFRLLEEHAGDNKWLARYDFLPVFIVTLGLGVIIIEI